VAPVHTQAAGENGPVDSMIRKLKQLSKEQGFEVWIVYAQDPATYETIFRTLGDAGASVVVSTFNEVAEPFKAVAPSYSTPKPNSSSCSVMPSNRRYRILSVWYYTRPPELS
jgi:basic membrane protein A